jgi:hypothetical protein
MVALFCRKIRPLKKKIEIHKSRCPLENIEKAAIKPIRGMQLYRHSRWLGLCIVSLLMIINHVDGK